MNYVVQIVLTSGEYPLEGDVVLSRRVEIELVKINPPGGRGTDMLIPLTSYRQHLAGAGVNEAYT